MSRRAKAPSLIHNYYTCLACSTDDHTNCAGIQRSKIMKSRKGPWIKIDECICSDIECIIERQELEVIEGVDASSEYRDE